MKTPTEKRQAHRDKTVADAKARAETERMKNNRTAYNAATADAVQKHANCKTNTGNEGKSQYDSPNLPPEPEDVVAEPVKEEAPKKEQGPKDETPPKKETEKKGLFGMGKGNKNK